MPAKRPQLTKDLPYYEHWLLRQLSVERKIGMLTDRPAIIVEDTQYLDFDADRAWKGNKGRDMTRGSV